MKLTANRLGSSFSFKRCLELLVNIARKHSAEFVTFLST